MGFLLFLLENNKVKLTKAIIFWFSYHLLDGALLKAHLLVLFSIIS